MKNKWELEQGWFKWYRQDNRPEPHMVSLKNSDRLKSTPYRRQNILHIQKYLYKLFCQLSPLLVITRNKLNYDGSTYMNITHKHAHIPYIMSWQAGVIYLQINTAASNDRVKHPSNNIYSSKHDPKNQSIAGSSVQLHMEPLSIRCNLTSCNMFSFSGIWYCCMVWKDSQ